MSGKTSIVLVKEHVTGNYYDYIGRVNIIRGQDGSISYVLIEDKDTGEILGQIDTRYNDMFAKYEGKVIKFRGRECSPGLIIPHTK